MLCHKHSQFAALMEQYLGAQPGADPDGGLSTGLALEEVLLLYKQSGHKKLHLRYALEAGHIEDKRITLKAFQDAHHIKAVFQRLALFATECEQNVSARFPAAGVFKHFDIFEDDWEFSQAGLSASAKAFADFFKLPLPDLRKELSVLFAAREAARQGGSSAWPAVLHRVADQRLNHALKVAGALLLMMSQSAENERVFARVERLKSCLGEQGDGQLYEQYLWAQNGPTIEQASSIVDSAAHAFLSLKERRFASIEVGSFYRRGNKVMPRKRCQRSDKGTHGIRKPRQVTKKHARLKAMPVLRGLVKENAVAQLEADAGAADDAAAVPAIEVQMSPRKKRRRSKVAASESEDE